MITKLDKEFTRSLAKLDKREDGRALDQFRDLSIVANYANNAEGSALVTLGQTQVLVGVKLSTAEPFDDTPDEGVLMVSAELGPKASPEFEQGPPKENAVEIARVVDRGIRESKAVDLNKLCIKEGENVWMLAVDIDVLNDSGNLMDAAGIGAIAALLTARVPKLDEEGKIVQGEYSGKVPVVRIPIPVTVVKIDDKLMVDPDFEEEEAIDARLTITSVEGGTLCAMQKGGDKNLAWHDVARAADIAVHKANEIRNVVLKAVGK